MILLTANTFEKARDAIKKSKNKNIAFSSNDDDLNRKVIEKLPIKTLLLNQKGRKDYQKQRNSGFNQVMAKIAKKNKITLGINLDEITQTKGKEKADILARIKQNIKICNKNKLQMKFIGGNQRNSHDLKALGLTLGMPTKIIKQL